MVKQEQSILEYSIQLNVIYVMVPPHSNERC